MGPRGGLLPELPFGGGPRGAPNGMLATGEKASLPLALQGPQEGAPVGGTPGREEKAYKTMISLNNPPKFLTRKVSHEPTTRIRSASS